MRVFNETQRFNQWWLQLVNLSILVLFFFGLYRWSIRNENFGNVAADDLTSQLIFSISIVLVLILLYFIKLQTTIDEIGIHYHYLPFHSSKKTIRRGDMKECYVRKYNPIGEYGGWGLRGSFGKNKAYNVKGNKGIQVVLKTDEKILIGTQKENEAQLVIDRYFKTNIERI